eukprot:Skav222415  [mRNA]  locus=scaffold2890:18891:23754:+ [translate_table: standard]
MDLAIRLQKLRLPASQETVDQALRPFLQGRGFLSWQQRPQKVTRILSAFRRSPDLVLQILHTILAARLEGNVHHFNVAIEGFAQQRAWEEVLSLLNKMNAVQILPNVVSTASCIKACGKGGQWLMALEVLQQSFNLRISPDLRLLTGSISSLDGQWRMAVHLFDSMPELGLSPDIFAFNTVLKALAKGKEWEIACAFFHSMDSRQVSPSIVTANTVIAMLSIPKKWWLTLDILENLPSKMLLPDQITYQSTLKALGGCSQWEQAIKVLNDMAGAKAVEFGLTVGACSNAHQWPHALQLLSLLRERKVKEDLLLQNAVMKACGQAKEWQHVVVLFAELDLELDQRVISTAIAACDSQWEQVLCLLGSLPKLKMSSSLLTHTPAVQACGEVSQWQWAVHLLDALEQQEVEADAILYTTAISASCSACFYKNQPTGEVGDGFESNQPWPYALSLFAKLKGLSLPADRIAYTAIISTCGKANKWEHSLELLRESQQANIQSDSTSYAAAIAACQEQWRYALSLISELHLSQIQLDIVACNAAISCCAEASQWKHATRLLGFPTLVRLHKDIVTFTAAMSASEKSCRWREAVDLLEQVYKGSLELTIVSYNLLISACAKGEQWHLGLELLKELEVARVQSNMITQSVAINAYGRGLQWQASLHMLADAEAPNVVVFGTLLNALQHGSLWEQAVKTLHAMMDAELEPSVACYDYTLLACQAARRERLALDLLLRSRRNRSAAASKIDSFNVDELSMLVSGASDVSTDLLGLAQETTAVMVADAVDKSSGSSWASFDEAGKELLGIIFSCRLMGCLQARFRDFMRNSMKAVGAGMDIAAEAGKRTKLPSYESSEYNKLHLTILDCSDRSVLFKPPGWEVYGQHVDFQLSDFARARFGNLPILYNEQHNLGFLHRLDVPSSGLILVAKSYEAFYDLQVQLHAGDLQRDYTVLCHGRLPSTLIEVTARLEPNEEGPTVAGKGKISFSNITCQSTYLHHAGALSKALLAIDTGRKHQIRSHLAHVGHPVVRDSLYTSLDTFKSDASLSPRNWLHRHRLLFQDAAGKTHEVFSELPQDLRLPSIKPFSCK